MAAHLHQVSVREGPRGYAVAEVGPIAFGAAIRDPLQDVHLSGTQSGHALCLREMLHEVQWQPAV